MDDARIADALIALAQMTSGIDADANLDAMVGAMARARGGGAAMVFFPEMSALLDRDRTRSAAALHHDRDSPWLTRLCDAAAREGIWVHTGSMPFLSDDAGDTRRVNRSHVIDATGRVVARYDKRHMFDVDLPTGERWRESDSYAPGTDGAVVVDTPIGRLGLAICFDLRFPEHFAALVTAGADCIAIPAAFTVPTGVAHWHVLMRARAIETQCHVVAAAQCGRHADGRLTFGHSLAVAPWGEVLADMGNEGAGVRFVALDREAVSRARAAIPLTRP